MLQRTTSQAPRYGRLVLWLVIGVAFLGLAYQAVNSFRNPSVTVEWITTGEDGIEGFNLYRADGSESSYRKINQELIPGAPNPARGADYSFTDTEVVAGETYSYRVEEVGAAGGTNLLRPIVLTAQSGGWLQLIALAALALAVLLIVSPETLHRRGGRVSEKE